MASLSTFTIPNFQNGFNDFAGSSWLTRKDEVPAGENFISKGIGSYSTRNSWEKCSPLLPGVPQGGTDFKTSSATYSLVAIAGTIYSYTTSSLTPLTGKTFSSTGDIYFASAHGRCYIADGVNKLWYTTDGTTLVEATNSVPLIFLVSAYNRLYGIDPSDKSKCLFSNDATITYSGSSVTLDLSEFDDFRTDVAAVNKKNAGFFLFNGGKGTQVLGMDSSRDASGNVILSASVVEQGTKRVEYKVYRIVQSGVDATTGVLNHNATIATDSTCAISPRSIAVVGNDLWFFDKDRNITSLGEVAQFQNVKPLVKSASVKTTMNAIPYNGTFNVAMAVYLADVYVSIQRGGTQNDTFFIYNTRTGAWSTPCTGRSFKFFLTSVQGGQERLIGFPASSSDLYMYRLTDGYSRTDDAYDSWFETTHTDCDTDSYKRFAIGSLSISQGSGTLNVTPILDEVDQTTTTIPLGSTQTRTAGNATFVSGTVPSGTSVTSGISGVVSQDRQYWHDMEYNPAHRVGVRYYSTGPDSFVDITQAYFKYKKSKSPYEGISLN